MLSIEEQLLYLHTAEELNMADTSNTEPAGAERFRAVSFPNAPAKAAPPVPVSVEDRLNALEAMVHELASHTLSASTHPGVIAWMRGIGAKIKADLERVF